MGVKIKLGVGDTANIREVYASRAKALRGEALRGTLQDMGQAIVSKYEENIMDGGFADLATKYKQRKQKMWGHIYPILVASGQLLASFKARVFFEGGVRWVIQVTSPGQHIDERGRSMANNKLAQLHIDGTANMPARDFTKLGAGFYNHWRAVIRSAIRSSSRR